MEVKVMWEYKILEDPNETDLNKLGADGWEFIFATEVALNDTIYRTVYLRRTMEV